MMVLVPKEVLWELVKTMNIKGWILVPAIKKYSINLFIFLLSMHEFLLHKKEFYY